MNGLLDLARRRKMIEEWSRSRTLPQRVVLRSRIVLMLGNGYSARAVGRLLGVSRHTVNLWRRRFSDGGCDALAKDKPGRGRKPQASNASARSLDS
jgi:transposase